MPGDCGETDLCRTAIDNLCQISHRTVMRISLTPELEKAIKAKVASGLYNSASEVVREALRESLRREHENDWLQREAAIGFARLDAGEVVRIKSREDFVAAVRGDS